MEIVRTNNHLCLIGRYAFHIVGPPAAELNGGFNSFSSRIHGEYFVIAKAFGDGLLKGPQLCVVKGTRCQRKRLCLLHEGADNSGMAVSLIDRRIGTQEIKVLLALDVPNANPLALLQDNG